MSNHLEVTTTGRGFAHFPPIPGEYGGEATVYESSSASGPHVWLGVTPGATLLLTAENAWKVAEQIMTLVANHYQGDARPDQRFADLLAEKKG